MLDRRRFVLSAVALVACGKVTPASSLESGGNAQKSPALTGLVPDPDSVTTVTIPESEWRAKLPADAFHVLREAGTEYAFSGRYANYHGAGRFLCAGCGLALFSGGDKFDSGTGWPSFTKPIRPDRVLVNQDTTLGMVRDEVRCARCDGHLGHVFPDGPPPTGLRYCMNSVSLLLEASS
jgi:peptide-methionine (R)-S-oxide reductase